MKKLRLNKIFHWLYAILMFLPFICVFGYILSAFGTGNFDMDIIKSILGLFESIFNYAPVDNVFEWLGTFFDMSNDVVPLLYIFSYWVMISLIWLCFDVVIYLINLFHRWIDEGGI